MTVLSVSHIYQSKCEYADLEYFSEAIYEKLSKYCAENINNMDIEDLVAGEFEVFVNWKRR
jgi:hypothetical protein